jgi:predicted nucleic acid-binding protein
MNDRDDKAPGSGPGIALDLFGDVTKEELARAAEEERLERERLIEEELAREAEREAAERRAREEAELEEARKGLVKRTGWRMLFSFKALAVIALMLAGTALATGLILNPDMTLPDVLHMYQQKLEYVIGLAK